MLERGQPQAGETVLVSGAAGAVGSVVGQIAKIKVPQLDLCYSHNNGEARGFLPLHRGLNSYDDREIRWFLQLYNELNLGADSIVSRYSNRNQGFLEMFSG